METTLAFVLGAAGLVLLAVLVLALLRLNRDMSALKASQDADETAPGMLMLQNQVDAAQRLDGAEMFFDALHLDDRGRFHNCAICPPSTRREIKTIGIVMGIL